MEVAAETQHIEAEAVEAVEGQMNKRGPEVAGIVVDEDT